MGKKFLFAMGVLALVVLLIGLSSSANCQSIRPFMCGIFECQAFKDLVALVTGIQTDTQQIIAETAATTEQLGYLVANTTTLAQDLQRIEGKVDNLGGSGGATQAQIELITTRLGYIMKAEASLWFEIFVQEATGDVFIELWVKGESMREITAFGFDVTYPATHAQAAEVIRGDLLLSWQTLEGNEIQPGQYRIGAFAGAASPIIGTAIGRLLSIRLTPVAGAGNFGLCIQDYVDDFTDMNPNPLCDNVIVQ